MNKEYECIINGIYGKIIIYRTYIKCIYNSINIKIGFFDIIVCNIINNKLVIKTEYFNDILITSNNKKKIFNNILINIGNLKYDMKISDLIVDNKEIFTCAICLEENTKQNEIVKLKCCNNLLHYKCYLEYLKNSKLYNCPLCRNIKCPICLGKGC